jgi:predicted transcriptional regulator
MSRVSRGELVAVKSDRLPTVDDGRMLIMENTDKQRAIEALRSLPEHATIEDAIKRLCFIAKIEEGLRQSNEGQLVSHEEIKKQFVL